MARRRHAVPLVTLALAAVPLQAAAATGDGYAPDGADFVACDPDPAPRGATVECSAGLFDPGTPVDVVVTASTLLDTTLTAGPDGTVGFDFEVPADHPTGTFAVGLEGIRDGVPSTTSTTGGIGTPDEESPIVETGSAPLSPGLLAIALLATGGVVLVAARRRA